MAAVAPTISDVSPNGDGSAILVQWTPVTSATSDTCNPVKYPKHTIKSVQVAGTFGGGSVGVSGSNDGTNYEPLNTPANSAIAITSAAINKVLENTLDVEPVLTGGSSTSLTITMLLVMPNPART